MVVDGDSPSYVNQWVIYYLTGLWNKVYRSSAQLIGWWVRVAACMCCLRVDCYVNSQCLWKPRSLRLKWLLSSMSSVCSVKPHWGKNREKRALFMICWKVNILLIVFIDLEMLPSSTMNISVFTYIFMSKGSDGNDQPDQPPSLNTTLSLPVSFFLSSCLFHKTISKTTNITD